MANEVNIDTLSIQVSANAEPAAKSIGDLASAVKKFNSAVAGSKGFGDLVTLANVSKTASDNMKDAPNRLRELASALGEISQSMKGLKIPSDLSKGFSDIGTAVKSISANVGQRLQSLASGLSALRDAGEVRISNTIGNGISSINESLANLNVNNLSRIGRFVEGVRQLEAISGLTISGSVAREMTNIAEATELISLVDFGPLREMGNAVAHLAVANDIRINNRLAENIVNLAIAAQEVQGTDWTEFERMAEGLRHLEGLGEIRIPRIRGPRANANQQGGDGIATGDANATTDLDNIRNGANEAANAVAQVRSAIAQTNDVRAFLQSNNDADILAMRLAAARDRLQQLLNVGEGELNLRAIANTTEEVRKLEKELQDASRGAKALKAAMQFGSGFAQGVGLGGIVNLFINPFKTVGSIIGGVFRGAFDLVVSMARTSANAIGSAFKAAISLPGRIATAFKDIAVTGINVATDAAKTFVDWLGKGAQAGKGLLKVLVTVGKLEYSAFATLANTFGRSFINNISNAIKKVTQFVNSIGRIALYRLIRTAIKEIGKAFKEGTENLYQWSLLVDRTFANSMDKIATSMLYLKNSLGAMVAPIINSLAPAIDLVVDKFVEGINIVNQFLAAITGSDTYVAALKVPTEWAENETEKAKKNIKELKKAILGFDELNLLTRDSRSDTQKNGKHVADYASMFENRKVESSIAAFARKIREAFASGEWGKAGNLFAKKLNKWVDEIDWDGLGRKIGKGINKLVEFYNEFMDGVEWKNIGKKFTEGINGLLDEVHFDELGESLVKGVNALFETLSGVFDELHWDVFGIKLVDFAWGIVDGVDWNAIADAASSFINGLADSFMVFASKFPWADVGIKIANGVNRLLDKIEYNNVADTLIALLEGMLDSIWNFLETVDSKANQHGTKIERAVMRFVNKFPAQKVAITLTKGIETAIDLAMPLLSNEGFWTGIGDKIVIMFNALFSDHTLIVKVAKALGTMVTGALASVDTILSGISETDISFALHAIVGEVFSDKNVSKMWDLIKKAVAKGGNFIDSLFMMEESSTDANSQYVAWFNKQPIGSRVAMFIKKALDIDFWKGLGTEIMTFARKGFTEAGNFITTLLDIDKAEVNKKGMARALGDKLRTLLGDGGMWSSIMTTVMNAVRQSSTAAGGFISTLLGETYSTYIDEMGVPRKIKDGLGTQIGKKIAEAIGSIKWGEGGIGGLIKQAATSLFGEFSGFFNGLTGDGSLYNAIRDFFGTFINDDGEFFGQLGESLKGMLYAAGKTFGKAFIDGIGGAIKGGFNRIVFGNSAGLPEEEKFENVAKGLGRSALKNDDQYVLTDVFNSTEALEQAKQLGKAYGETYVGGVKEAVEPKNENGGIWGAIKNGWRALFPGAQAEEGQGMYNADFLNDMGTGSSNQNGSNSIIQQTVGPMLYGVSTTLDNYAQNVVPKKMEAIKTAFSEGWELVHQAVKTVFGDIFYGIYQTMDTASNTAIPGKLVNLNTAFVTGWETIKETVKTAYGAMFFGLYSTMDTANNSTIPDKLSTTNEVFTTNWNNIQATVKTAYGNMFYGLYTTMDNANTSAIPGKMAAMSSLFANGFSSIASGAAIAMTQIQSVVLQAMVNLESTVPSRFRNMYNDVVNMTNSLMDRVESAVNGIIDGLNNALRIHLEFDRPDWAGGGSYWWDWNANLPHIGLGRVNALAQGGILQGPTMLARDVLAGEAGREAVLPLDNNTDWMNEVADRVNERSVYAGGSAQYGEDHADSTDVSGLESLLRAVLVQVTELNSKDMTMEVTTGQIQKAQQRTNRRAGITVIPVN